MIGTMSELISSAVFIGSDAQGMAQEHAAGSRRGFAASPDVQPAAPEGTACARRSLRSARRHQLRGLRSPMQYGAQSAVALLRAGRSARQRSYNPANKNKAGIRVMTDMTEDERRIHKDAVDFARKNKKAIARKLTDTSLFLPDDAPVSVFMAGSPGAGKTESSRELIATLEKQHPNGKILRIDADDLRGQFSEYNGSNAWLFQAGASILVEKILDFALENRQSFILDGTLSNYARAEANIQRSLGRDRLVQVLYVYQDPLLAWCVVKARELTDGRRVPRNRFIEQYFAARTVVNRLKTTFRADIKIDVLMKPYDDSGKRVRATWQNVQSVDPFAPEPYSSREELELALNSMD